MSFEFKITERIEKIKIDGMSCREIANRIGFYSKFEIIEIQKVLNNMVKNGKLKEKGNKYFKVREVKKIKGVLRGNKRGFAFLAREDGGEDLFVPHKNLHGAEHGDTVYCVIVKGDEAKVVDILERGIKRIVGTYQKSKNYGFVIADDNSYYSDIFIPSGADIKALNNTKVIVEITKYTGRNPEGKIVEIIGKAGEKQSDVLSILKSYGFFNVFPKETEEEARKMQTKYTTNRTSFVDMLTISIDGDDSKDLDDAISVFKYDNYYKLYVHIADVSHFVEKGSKLDQEAFKRCTSVYFPNNVYPMLPPVLSNGLCSLNGGEDRLALTCEMTINFEGDVIDRRIVKSIINNDYAMTYNNVQKILDGDKELIERYSKVYELICNAYDLSRILNKKRQQRGSINFETKECKVILNEKGNVAEIKPYPYLVSNSIIEEFMLIANETVAEYIFHMELPFVYRTHEEPDGEKMIEFRKFVESCGYKMERGKVYPSKLQKLLAEVEGSPMESIISKVMLRSMKKAKYTTENLGHFGLASEYYCHFTSPIRRYPDLQIHRVIKGMLDGNLGSIPKLANWCEEVAEVSSERERAAEMAERDIDDYYKAEYMQKHIGATFEGVISGVTAFGVFVELDNTCEGLARFENLPKDNYEFIENRYTLRGSKHRYTLGQVVKIEVLASDIDNRRVTFKILDDIDIEVENE
ncbi:MAG: ribonuclease R [Clostridia bacterium]|nr:ribonuclease R [Clostridia bacterium]